MNEQDMIVSIAELDGWTRVEVYQWTKDNPPTRIPKQYHIESDGEIVGLPQYITSLDAMRSAEDSLSHEALLEFDRRLFEVCGKNHQKCVHATAIQRSEAILRATGRWKPTPP